MVPPSRNRRGMSGASEQAHTVITMTSRGWTYGPTELARSVIQSDSRRHTMHRTAAAIVLAESVVLLDVFERSAAD